MDAGPLAHAGNEVFLDSVREHIEKSGDLCGLFVADHNGLIAAGPDLVLPTGEPGHFAGEFRIEQGHETGELIGVLNLKQ